MELYSSLESSGSRRRFSDGASTDKTHMLAAYLPVPLFLRRICSRNWTFVRQVVIIGLILVLYVYLLFDVEITTSTHRRSKVPIRTGLCHTGKNGIEYHYHSRYALALDAGSTGTRIHVYEFEYCGNRLKRLVDEVFRQVEPGLSAYHEDPQQAAHSLEPLLRAARQRVPADLKACTSIMLKATAGLRLLPEGTAEKILNAVKGWLSKQPFALGTAKPSSSSKMIDYQKQQLQQANESRRHIIGDAVDIMDGSQEGVYAWVTINFLEEKIGGSFKEIVITDAPKKSVDDLSVIMDLGGGSTQLVFAVYRGDEPPSPSDIPKLDPNFYYPLDFHGEQIYLYQHSFLGYGLVEARRSVKASFIHANTPNILHAGTKDALTYFPCFPVGHAEDHIHAQQLPVKLVGNTGGWDACREAVGKIFGSNEKCALEPCSFNGIHQPQLNTKQPLVAFSYFYDRTIPLGLTSPMNLAQIQTAGRRLCSEPTAQQIRTNPEWCLDIVYIYTLLRVAYGIEEHREINVAKQVNNYEAGWTLGLALKMLSETPDWCPAAEH